MLADVCTTEKLVQYIVRALSTRLEKYRVVLVYFYVGYRLSAARRSADGVEMMPVLALSVFMKTYTPKRSDSSSFTQSYHWGNSAVQHHKTIAKASPAVSPGDSGHLF